MTHCCGDIGDNPREYEFEPFPFTAPIPEPIPAPAESHLTDVEVIR
jgi:hypothetical protein